jgi:DmsE family decaheme c-type cytochrome
MIAGALVWLTAFMCVFSVGSKAPVAAENPAAGAAFSAQQAAGATYVGRETCLVCHASEGDTYEKSAHHFAMDPRTPAAARACETCHGPGSLHAAAPNPGAVPMINPAKLAPDAASALCTSCHKTSAHALWDGSAHEARNLSCTTCHSQHAAKSEVKLLKGSTQMETCGTCHRDKIAKLDRSGHMPVREGKMECSTCHNPHGSTNVRLLKIGDSIAETCTSCHADKRGPFLWEHAPARDGCVTCHDPHGSSNERMLVARPPILCQRCHVSVRHPSTIYDAGVIQTSVRVYARSCVTCHANIHGSNHPSGNRFLR